MLNAERSRISRARAGGGYTLFSVDNGTLSLPGLFSGKSGVAMALLEASEEGLWLPAILSAGLAGWPLIKG